MQDNKNEQVMKISSKFMNDCDNFEIKDLGTNSSKCDEVPDIELCSEYIKSHELGAKEQFRRHIVITGNPEFDEIGFLEKGYFKLFYTNNLNLPVSRILNNFILEAAENDKKIMALSTFSDFIVGEYLGAIRCKTNEVKVNTWFDNKNLYICEYSEFENIFPLLKNIESKIDELNIDVLYLPNLETVFKDYCEDLQADILTYLYELSFMKQISIIATLSPYQTKEDLNGVFCSEHKINDEFFNSKFPLESRHNVVSNDNETVTIECWDYWDYLNDKPKIVTIKSSNEFYTFDSITSYTKGYYDDDLPF